MTLNETVLYQIYPLGLCGAPAENTEDAAGRRLERVGNFIPHIRALGANAVLFNPLFESDSHGYDTRDYRRVDRRLGTNEDFRALCGALHDAGLRVYLDAVFNHVGRGFWAFRDVQEKKWDSPYRDWFRLRFDGDSPYGDGFWYEGWEGHYELVKLNLQNPAVADYLLETVKFWVEAFGVDGLRLDVAYCLDGEFLRRLRRFCEELGPEFYLLGETLHGDYNRWMNGDACHAVTNYECYKGIWSSFNSANFHEIAYSLDRQFGPQPWCLYTGKTLWSFLDNHDVTRIASILSDGNHLAPAYGLLFGMPGMPAVYYGSEWGIPGRKEEGDAALRPALEGPEWNGLTEYIQALIRARRDSEALCYGGYRNVLVQPRQLIFERQAGGQRVLVALNADAQPVWAGFDAGCARGRDLITGEVREFAGGCELGTYSCAYWVCE